MRLGRRQNRGDRSAQGFRIGCIGRERQGLVGSVMHSHDIEPAAAFGHELFVALVQDGQFGGGEVSRFELGISGTVGTLADLIDVTGSRTVVAEEVFGFCHQQESVGITVQDNIGIQITDTAVHMAHVFEHGGTEDAGCRIGSGITLVESGAATAVFLVEGLHEGFLVLVTVHAATLQVQRVSQKVSVLIVEGVYPDGGLVVELRGVVRGFRIVEAERPLSEIFSECLGRPVCISNDTRSMAYAEYLKGCANGEKNVIFINVNWGIGVGLILDGKPYFGKSGYSGEFGHIHAFENQIICRCGKMGCLETEMSGLALVRKLTDRIRKGHSSILSERVLKSEKPLILEEILLALKQEDTLCIDVIEEIGGLLGIRVAGLINLFNPELVVIGGILSGAGDYLLQPLRMNIIKHSLALANQDTVIRTSTLGARTGIIGSCLVARSYDFSLYC